MAEITFQSVTDLVELTPVTLSASDTFILPSSGRAFIQIEGNSKATVSITGEGLPSSVQVSGYGEATFNALTIDVDEDKTFIQPLNKHAELLKGTVTITGGETMTAYLYTI